MSADDLYRQLLRLVYRFLFLLVSEDRGLITTNVTYREHYGVERIRKLVDSQAARTGHDDLWQSLRVLWKLLSNAGFASHLQLAPLNGELFAPQSLDGYAISNRDLLEAFWWLAWYDDAGTRRRVNYAALDVEELGSVYESLLEFHPALMENGATPKFDLLSGSERKSTGSYYTPPELVSELIKSALEPVIAERLKEAANSETKKQALLSLCVIDPACGSGHFLLAAARCIGRALAQIESGEQEPAPEAMRKAIRAVISHCIHGVDRNPLAVDLCRVALWIEGHAAGKPLTFLDHRIRCGDSLVGVLDLAVLKQGIPDEAFKPMTGDDAQIARGLKARNRAERAGQHAFSEQGLDVFANAHRQIDAIANDTTEAIAKQKAALTAAHCDPGWLRQHEACNLYTAAFFQTFAPSEAAITTSALEKRLSGQAVDPRVAAAAETISLRQHAFHWPLEFPDVFKEGGFHVVFSNPPWERIKLSQKEFFALRDPEIAAAPNKAARARLIAKLPENNPALFAQFTAVSHDAEALGKFLRQSTRYPLTATGDINTYAVFAELISQLIKRDGRAAVILPAGITTDDTTKRFFQNVVSERKLVSFFGFDNARRIFPAVHPDTPFVLLTLGKHETPIASAHYLLEIAHYRDARRHFSLQNEDFGLFNPNTLTSPIFRSRADAELTRTIYSRVPLLVREGAHDGNPWGISFLRMLDMSNDSTLFKNAPEAGFLPLYEAKLMHQFDHRFATYLPGGGTCDCTSEEKANRGFRVTPRYWVEEREVLNRLAPPEAEEKAALAEGKLNEAELIRRQRDRAPKWLLGFRDITNATNERTAIFSFLPVVGAGHKIPLIFLDPNLPVELWFCLSANLNSLPLDYVARQKLGGTSFTYFVVRQLPVLPPTSYSPSDLAYIAPRVAALVNIADDLVVPCSFPFESAGSEEKRALIRAELDAFYAKKYGLTRDELRYILYPADVYGADFPSETFRVLKKNEIARFGEYRTRRLVLEAWDRVA